MKYSSIIDKVVLVVLVLICVYAGYKLYQARQKNRSQAK
jgi:predicted negative regulator of RcsB-dependent stress response